MESFVIWKYIVIVIVGNLIHYMMAEGQHGIDDVVVARKRALRFVIDDSVIFERIVALMRSKAGHLSEITKIYRIGLISTVRITSFYLKVEAKLTAWTLSGNNMHMFITI